MYSAARNGTERRVDDATHEILFVLEIYSELVLRLASLTQYFAMPAPEYPSANRGICGPGFTSGSTGAPTRPLTLL